MAENGLTQITINQKGITWELKNLIENNKNCKMSDGKITASEWDKTMDALADIDMERRRKNETPIFTCSCYDKSKDKYQENFIVQPGQKIEFTQSEMEQIYNAMGVELTNTQEKKPKETPVTTSQSEPNDTTALIKKAPITEVNSDSTSLVKTPETQTEQSSANVDKNTDVDKANKKGKLFTVGVFLLVCAGLILTKNKTSKINKKILAGEKDITSNVSKTKNHAPKINLEGIRNLLVEKIQANRITRQISRQEAKYKKEYDYLMQEYDKVKESLKNAGYDYDYSTATNYLKHASCGKNRSIVENTLGKEHKLILVNDKKYGKFKSFDHPADSILMEYNISDGTLKKAGKILGTKKDTHIALGNYKKYADGRIESESRSGNTITVRRIQNGKIREISTTTEVKDNVFATTTNESYLDDRGILQEVINVTRDV